jgi:D-alanyl-D-alanine carboxypeptidase
MKDINKTQAVRFRTAGVRLAALVLTLCSCEKGAARDAEAKPDGMETMTVAGSAAGVSAMAETPDIYEQRLRRTLEAAGIPEDMGMRIMAADEREFLTDLSAATEGDPFLWRLVDKQHALPEGYEPDDLVTLGSDASYNIGRAGLRLRREAAEALERMARAARADGVTLVVSSTYRSFDYQKEVYERNVRESGQETADRESSRAGFSQHQLGLVVDFGSITDAFAQTAAGRWMLANAPDYGWSLSFPDGYEQITGYRWESWHYRYTGVPLAAFIDKWFDGIQQYALQFIHEWEKWK